MSAWVSGTTSRCRSPAASVSLMITSLRLSNGSSHHARARSRSCASSNRRPPPPGACGSGREGPAGDLLVGGELDLLAGHGCNLAQRLRGRAPASRSARGLEVRRSTSPSARNGTISRTRRVRLRCRSRGVPAAEVDGLGGDDELDRDHRLAERDHLGQPAGGEGPSSSVLDPPRAWSSPARGDGLSEKTCLRGERLRGRRARPASSASPPRCEPVREPGERSCRSLSSRSAEVVSAGRARCGGSRVLRQREDLEVRDRDDAVLVGNDERVLLGRVARSRAGRARTRAHRGSRAAAGARGRRADPGGSAPPRAPRASCPPAASQAGQGLGEAGYGRTCAIAGCSSVRLAANASRSSAPATSMASSRRSVSATASAAMPVENAFELTSASASFASSSASNGRARGRPWREGRPGRASREAGRGMLRAFRAAASRSASSGRTPGCRWRARSPAGASSRARSPRRVRPGADQVVCDQRAVEGADLLGRNGDLLPRAHAGRHPVDVAALEHALDERPGAAHPLEARPGRAPRPRPRARRPTSPIVRLRPSRTTVVNPRPRRPSRRSSRASRSSSSESELPTTEVAKPHCGEERACPAAARPAGRGSGPQAPRPSRLDVFVVTSPSTQIASSATCASGSKPPERASSYSSRMR